jgi:hypothetical protein
MDSTGKIPTDFKRNVIIPIPKKKKVERCEEYRTISFTIDAFEILTRILYRRMEQKIEEFLDEDLFGFR